MRKRFTSILGLLMLLSAPMQAQDFESATDAVKNMGIGWNLGNTLDANTGSGKLFTEEGYWGVQGLESETCWGQPVTKPELFTMFKEAGFGAIRVPVTWYNHMDKDGKVDAAWMKRVHEVVDYVIDAGLYCIINVHHDTGADGTPFHSWLKADEDNYTQNKERFEGLWTQIATEFKDYDEHLIFGAYNEMLDKYDSWCFATFGRSGGYDAADAASAYAAINSYAQSFCSAVRATGGNNATRNLIINTYGSCNGSGTWNSHLKDPLTEMKMPEGESNHIIFEVHNYPSISNLSSAKKEFGQNIQDLQETLGALGAPIIYGEWGTSSNNGDGTNDYADNRDNLFDFVTYALKAVKEAGMAAFWWMGISDGAYRNEPAFSQPDLAETMAKAWHGEEFAGTYPTISESSGVTAWEGEQALMWSTWLKIEGSVFATMKSDMQLQITYTQEAANADGGDLQFWYGDWSSKLTVKVGDTEFAGDFNPDEYYGTTDQTYTTAFTFSEEAFNNLCQKGMLLDGQNVILKKVVLAPATDIKAVKTSNITDAIQIYNLAGQRVASPKKGIYIRNGKKVVIK